eukprot:13009690-Heterocapsa_arctica.AAC.1
MAEELEDRRAIALPVGQRERPRHILRMIDPQEVVNGSSSPGFQLCVRRDDVVVEELPLDRWEVRRPERIEWDMCH